MKIGENSRKFNEQPRKQRKQKEAQSSREQKHKKAKITSKACKHIKAQHTHTQNANTHWFRRGQIELFCWFLAKFWKFETCIFWWLLATFWNMLGKRWPSFEDFSGYFAIFKVWKILNISAMFGQTTPAKSNLPPAAIRTKHQQRSSPKTPKTSANNLGMKKTSTHHWIDPLKVPIFENFVIFWNFLFLAQKVAAKPYFWTIFYGISSKSSGESFSGAKNPQNR